MAAAGDLDFELAAQIREQLFALKGEPDTRREQALAHWGGLQRKGGRKKKRDGR